jgi:hypothetical protein
MATRSLKRGCIYVSLSVASMPAKVPRRKSTANQRI